MSFLNTHPEALSSAAGALQTIAGALNAQNAAAVSPITGLAPAAADEVSALQATQFSAYGTLYQQISAQAAAMQELFIQTLRTSADSYGETETANSAAATTTSGLSAASNLVGSGTGTTPAVDPTYGLGGIASNTAILATMQSTNLAAGASAFTSLGTGFITNPSGVVHHVTGAVEGNLASATTPVAGAAPIAAGTGQAPQVNKLSEAPGWAAEAEETEEATSLAAAEPTPGPHGATTLPAGIPAAAAGNRGRYGFGRPTYGVKPVVMPRKPIV